MRWLRNWLRRWLGIERDAATVASHHQHIHKCIDAFREATYARMDNLEGVMRHRTELHADIHFKGQNWAILIGQYKGRDYVEAFPLPAEALRGLVERMRHETRHAKRGRIDAPPTFSATFDRDLR